MDILISPFKFFGRSQRPDIWTMDTLNQTSWFGRLNS